MQEPIIFSEYQRDLGECISGDIKNFSVQITNNSNNSIKIDCLSKCSCTKFDKSQDSKLTKELEPFSHHYINGTIDTKGMLGRVRKSFDLIYYFKDIRDVVSRNVAFELTIK